MKILGAKSNVWAAIWAIERKNLDNPSSEPIIMLTDNTVNSSHAGLHILNNYYAKLEKSPERSISDTEINSIKYQHTHDGMIECQYCLQQIESHNITIDHFIPFYLGGRTHYGNLRLACPKCNRMKGSVHPYLMTETWKLFQRNIAEYRFVKSLALIQETLTRTLSLEEHQLALKLHEKEMEWRATLKEEWEAKKVVAA